MRFLLVAGIPASGKSSFGRWMSQQHRFRHEDLEKHSNHLEWLQRKPARSFIDEVRWGQPDFILDWGFPPNASTLATVRRLVEAGMTPWWFDGDRTAALESFLARGSPLRDWEVQMPKIEANWGEIEAIFGSNHIEAVSRGPVYTPPENIYEQMLGSPSAG
jgi:hypothetical protein